MDTFLECHAQNMVGIPPIEVFGKSPLQYKHNYHVCMVSKPTVSLPAGGSLALQYMGWLMCHGVSRYCICLVRGLSRSRMWDTPWMIVLLKIKLICSSIARSGRMSLYFQFSCVHQDIQAVIIWYSWGCPSFTSRSSKPMCRWCSEYQISHYISI